MTVRPFTIAIPQSTLDDLRDRLARTRWPDEPDGVGWSYGTNLAYMQELVDYWRTGFDWRAQEAALNRLDQYSTEIGGVQIHFVHQRGKGPNPLPLLLIHGWPDTFQRFHKVIPLLSDPARFGGRAEDSFDVIVPSLPGHGFSDRIALSSADTADLFAKLMSEELGYSRFVAAGGDVGSLVSQQLALRHPDLLAAIHLTNTNYPTGQEDPPLTAEEQEFAQYIQGWWFSQGAYAMLQSSKPQTAAFGLNDSPAGLAAWILSLVQTGADGDDVEAAFGGRDDLLTNMTIYWATQTAASAARRYMVEAQAGWGEQSAAPARSEVPTGLALFPRDAPVPRSWAERFNNIQSYRVMQRGGHFAALELPELFTDELRSFFGRYR